MKPCFGPSQEEEGLRVQLTNLSGKAYLCCHHHRYSSLSRHSNLASSLFLTAERGEIGLPWCIFDTTRGSWIAQAWPSPFCPGWESGHHTCSHRDPDSHYSCSSLVLDRGIEVVSNLTKTNTAGSGCFLRKITPLVPVLKAARVTCTWERRISEEVQEVRESTGIITSSSCPSTDPFWMELLELMNGLVISPSVTIIRHPYTIRIHEIESTPTLSGEAMDPNVSDFVKGYKIYLGTKLCVPLKIPSLKHDSVDVIGSPGHSTMPSQKETFRLSDLVIPSMQKTFEQCAELVSLPFVYGHLLDQTGISCPKGVLLSGPPGVGKTHLIRQLVAKFKCKLFLITQSSTESDIQHAFRYSSPQHQDEVPVLVFIDELDSIAPNRHGSSSMSGKSARMLSTLLTCMDGMGSHQGRARRAIVFAATNRPNSIDAALRRPGRLDREICLSPPTAEERESILRHFLDRLSVDKTGENSIDIRHIAQSTPGYVTADLIGILRTALLASSSANVSEDFGHTHGKRITQQVLMDAISKNPPSLTRSYQILYDKSLTWDDIAGYEELKLKIRHYIEWPTLHAQTYKRLGLKPVQGILLHGPSGCSKTSLVKVIAAQSKASFFSLSGAEVYSCYLGESEAILRALFRRAREASPSIIFLDELDTLVSSRGLSVGGGGTSDSISGRILATLLTEMDGIESLESVLVLGATNRLDCMDPALIRPGRFVPLAVPLPSRADRLAILGYLLKGVHAHDIGAKELDDLVCRTEGFSGADLKGLVQEACLQCMSLSFSEAPSPLPAESFFPLQVQHFASVLP